MPMILALDLGSTSFKAAVYDDALREVGRGGQPVAHDFLPGNRVELPVAVAEEAFRGAIAEALAAAAIKPEALRALALDSQAQTFTVQDAAGRARLPFLSWQDGRAVAAAAALAARPELAGVAEHGSFAQFLPALQVAMLHHVLGERPAGWLTASDRVLHLPSWFVQRLSGEAVVDDNLAAMSGLYSLRLGAWWPAALAAVGVAREQLARVVPIGSVAARVGAGGADWGLPAGLPIVLAGNDQTAGGYGAEVAQRQAPLITLGTCQVAYIAGANLRPAGPVLVRGPYPGGLTYCLVADSVGGSVINWAKTVIPGATTDDAFFALAEQAAPGCHGLVFDADLASSVGAWRQLGFHHQPADLARAVVEGLSRRLAGLIGALRLEPPPRQYLVAGGGSKSVLWRTILAQELGGAELVPTAANPLLGAARLAREALAR
jgi:sugar (pentulose or hexulose) kinase